MNQDLTLQIVFNNMPGEETVSHENLCWVTKTHWPLESPLGSQPFKAQKCISVVRNPIDVFPSMSYMINLTSHSHTSTELPNDVDPEWWNNFVTKMADNLNKQTLEMKAVEDAVPTYYIRYEDLVLNPQPVLMELFSFLLEVPSIAGTVVEKRVIDYCAKGSQAASVYKLKDNAAATRNLSKNVAMYTPEQMEMLKDKMREYLYFFKYTDHPEASQADADTTFFTYDGATQHDEDKLGELFGRFK